MFGTNTVCAVITAIELYVSRAISVYFDKRMIMPLYCAFFDFDGGDLDYCVALKCNVYIVCRIMQLAYRRKSKNSKALFIYVVHILILVKFFHFVDIVFNLFDKRLRRQNLDVLTKL